MPVGIKLKIQVNAFPIKVQKRAPTKQLQLLLATFMGAVLTLSGCTTSAIHEAATEGQMDKLKDYVAKGGNLEAQGDKNWVSGIYHYGGKTPLHMAVEGNQPEAVRYLIRQGADIEAKTSQGETPLLLSAKSGNIALFDLLLKQGANRFAKDNNNKTALLLALEGLAKDPLKALETTDALIVRKADVNARDRWQRTPLHLAAKHDLDAVARLLIKHGAEIRARDKYGETPLYASLISRLNTHKTFEYLVTLKQDFQVQNIKGRTLLHRTCRPDYIRTLLRKGVPTDRPDNDGDTPPFFALSTCPVEALSVYLEKGFDLASTGAKGRTVVLTALDNPFFRNEIVSFVLSKGADATQQDPEGRSAIHRAAAHSPRLLDLVIAHGGDINARTKTDSTPLHYAASINISRFIKQDFQKQRDLNTQAYAHLLAKPGIALNPQDIKGCTPLHRAVNSGSLEKIQLLLERGAKVNIREKREHTPMDMAVLKNDKQMVELFKQYGGSTTVDPNKHYRVLCAYP